MGATHGEQKQAPPAVLFIIGAVVFLLGCIWPAFMLDDFQNELEASSWPTTDATVVALDISIYEYQCGDSNNRDTCREYNVNYHLRFTINGTMFNVQESEEVSHFESRVWEVDYPVNSTREIAYNPENTEEIDVDPQNYTPFVGPILVFLCSTILTILLVLGGIKLLFNTSSKHSTLTGNDKKMLPQSNEEITFTYVKTIWGVQTYQHPTVEALAQKLASFSCTEQQIDAFFKACQTAGKDGAAYEDRIDLELLNEVNIMAEQHSSIEKYNLIQKANFARVILLGVSIIFVPVALVFSLPVWLKYQALPWYGWIPIWGILSPIGLVLATRQIIRKFGKRADQGLGESLIDFINNMDD